MNPMKQTAAILLLAIGPTALADLVSIDGVLGPSDFKTEEYWPPDPVGTWTFYYDVYNVISADGADIDVSMKRMDFDI